MFIALVSSLRAGVCSGMQALLHVGGVAGWGGGLVGPVGALLCLIVMCSMTVRQPFYIVIAGMVDLDPSSGQTLAGVNDPGRSCLLAPLVIFLGDCYGYS